MKRTSARSRYLFTFLCLFFLGKQAIAQNWQPLSTGMSWQVRAMYADTSSDLLYVGGSFSHAGGILVHGITIWDGTKFDSLACGVAGGLGTCIAVPPGSFGAQVLAITKYNNHLYIGGGFTYVDEMPAPGIAKWNGTQWDSVPDAPLRNGVLNFLVDSSHLYIMGWADGLGGTQHETRIAKYNGVNWEFLPILDSGSSFGVFATAIFYNGDLYVGGNFDGGDGLKDIARFDGTNWQSVGGGFTGFDTWVNKLYVWHDTLFVAGYFMKANGDPGNNIAAWDGSNWLEVGGGTMPSNVMDMIEFQGYLYVCGQINEAGGLPVNRMARWDGRQWCNLPADIDNTPGTFAVLNDELYIGGGFVTIDGDTMNNIAKWTGGNLTDTCGEILGQQEEIAPCTNITIHPNPFHDNFMLDFRFRSSAVLKISIYDLSGKEMLKSNKMPISDGLYREQFNTSHFPSGLYFLVVQIGDQKITRKMVKVR